MLSKTNLALASYNNYNDEIEIIKPDREIKTPPGTTQFLIHTKRALVWRENILASGMEVSDIDKACQLAKGRSRS